MVDHKKKEGSIRTRMAAMVLLPVLTLGLTIIFIGILLLYRLYSQSIQNELTATTNVILDCLNTTVRGDYAYESGMLLKGEMNITDSTMLYHIKEKSEIDTTVFWQDTRILSTVSNEYGVSAVGTKASRDVVEAVLERGECYYSTNLNVNGTSYVGYYVPLENVDHTVVGMVFAGKSKELVYQGIRTVLLWFIIVSGIVGILAVIVSIIYSNRMVSDISSINNFLKTISTGNLTVELDKRIACRNDELGRIGEYAFRMRQELQYLIERDPLTSLYNRRSCNNKLKLLESQQAEYTIVMCDIDWFKKINDSYGHDAGDYVLVTLSQLIGENINDCGFASRWGGEEFLLVYQLNYNAAIEKVRQIQQKIREYNFIYEDNAINVTLTFGVEATDGASSSRQKILTADRNLYIGKNNGRNQIVDGKQNPA